MTAMKPQWQHNWDVPIDTIRERLSTHMVFFVHTGIGTKWATYRQITDKSMKRVVSKYLPERETREEAERDLYCWIYNDQYD